MANALNFFKFLEDKTGRELPLKAKIMYAPETIGKEDLYIPRSLLITNSLIKYLPDNLTVG
jgi:hypothetical protein